MEFVVSSGPDAGKPHASAESRRTVRANAMRWARKQQQEKKRQALVEQNIKGGDIAVQPGTRVHREARIRRKSSDNEPLPGAAAHCWQVTPLPEATPRPPRTRTLHDNAGAKTNAIPVRQKTPPPIPRSMFTETTGVPVQTTPFSISSAPLSPQPAIDRAFYIESSPMYDSASYERAPVIGPDLYLTDPGLTVEQTLHMGGCEPLHLGLGSNYFYTEEELPQYGGSEIDHETSAISSMRSPEAYRQGMQVSFVEGFFPADLHGSSALANTLQAFFAPTTDSMAAAIDALRLLEFGHAKNEPRALFEGQRRHLAAVMLLKQELSDGSVDIDGVMGAAQLLLLCEVYSAVSSGPQAWRKHIPGICMLSRKRNISGSMPSALHAQLGGNLVHVCGVSRAIMRKAVDEYLLYPHPTLRWSAGDGGRLVQILLRLPALLERADTLKGMARPDPKQVTKTLSELLVLENGLLRWRKAFYMEKYGIDEPCSPTRDDADVEGDVPSKALRFASLQDAISLANFWGGLLLIRESLLDLTDRLPGSTANLPRDLLAEAEECADSLCESIPYLSEMAGGRMCRAATVRLPLYFASRWFAQTGNMEKLEWCRHVEANVRAGVPYVEWDALLPWSYYIAPWLFSSTLNRSKSKGPLYYARSWSDTM